MRESQAPILVAPVDDRYLHNLFVPGTTLDSILVVAIPSLLPLSLGYKGSY